MNEKTSKTNIIVEISKDQMIATICFDPSNDNSNIVYEDILEALKERGVCYGINHEIIKDVLKNRLFSSKVKIAEGSKAIPGLDGKIKYYFQTEKDMTPKIDDTGKADFFNLNTVINVKKDQLLAEIIPPTEGIEGKTVTGRVIHPKKGKRPRLHPGKNVYTSGDKCRFYSSIDGQPVIQNSSITVNAVIELGGDVGPKTGNIDFVGSIIVRGNVSSGYKIKSAGDVEIYGVVEAAEIDAGGSIILHRGIQGRDKGLLKAGLNVVAKFIENTKVIAGKEILVAEAIMHSYIYAAKTIKVLGRKGLLVGGISKAGEEIQAKTIGSPMATRTLIEVGADPEQKKQMSEVINSLTEVNSNLSKVMQSINLLNKLKQKDMLAKDKEVLLEKLLNTRDELLRQKDEFETKKNELELMMQIYIKAKVSVANTIFPGVNITIGNASLKLREQIEHATFYNFENQIKFTSYEGG